MSAPGTGGFKVGDLVRVGDGKIVWRVAYFWWAPSGSSMAALGPTGNSYSSTSVEVSRLRAAS